MKKRLLIALTGLTLLTAQPLIASDDKVSGDKAAGEAKSAVCLACHGPGGNSVNPEWPNLAGQHEDYIIKQLTNFKAKERHNDLMSPMADPLSEQDVADLAAYFSSQKSGQPPKVEEAAVALGEALYRGGDSAAGIAACIGCHGPKGKGNPQAKFPSVSGQHATYTALQLKSFRDGARSNDPGSMMRNLVVRMTDAEIDAVSKYMAGLN
jgi:cytochrome c553